MILGGDYSKWDPILDWPNHTWKYAFIKTSEGTREDGNFREQWSRAKGWVYRGGYHFFRPIVSWLDAAAKFCSVLQEDPGELPPVMDLEVTDGMSKEAIRDRALRWLREVESRCGKKPIIYTSPYFANSLAELWREPEFSNYILWQATYPWDEISADWSEEQRNDTILRVIHGEVLYVFPKAARPWLDRGKPVTFAQWTGKCPPEYVPGYPLGVKFAVDVNFYKGSLQELITQFNLPKLEGGTVSAKPITWKATLIAGQPVNFRVGPGLAAGIIQQGMTVNQDTEFQGTGTKVAKDGYYWGEVVTIGGQPRSGWIAFTISFKNVVWITNPPPSASKKAIGSRIYYDDGSSDVIGQAPS